MLVVLDSNDHEHVRIGTTILSKLFSFLVLSGDHVTTPTGIKLLSSFSCVETMSTSDGCDKTQLLATSGTLPDDAKQQPSLGSDLDP